MDNLIYILFVSIFIPVLLMTLLVNKNSRFPLIFVLAGIFISVFASEVNGFIKEFSSYEINRFVILITPITEEILKSLPIFYLALLVTDKKEKLFTASMATGIGFAILENAYYLLQNPMSFKMLDAIIRAFGAGLMHGMCTLLIGVGLSFVKKKRKMFSVSIFALLSTAITYHSIYNMLIQSEYSILGALLPIVTYIPFLIWRLRQKQTHAQ